MSNISSQAKTIYEQLGMCLDTVYLLKTENLLLNIVAKYFFNGQNTVHMFCASWLVHVL